MFAKKFIFCLCVSCLPFLASPAFSEEKDIFADYNADINKHADAKASSVYNAWGENMANMIQSGYRDGVVINGAGSYAGGKVQANGVGNINVARGANMGPIINNTKLDGSTIVFTGK